MLVAHTLAHTPSQTCWLLFFFSTSLFLSVRVIRNQRPLVLFFLFHISSLSLRKCLNWLILVKQGTKVMGYPLPEWCTERVHDPNRVSEQGGGNYFFVLKRRQLLENGGKFFSLLFEKGRKNFFRLSGEGGSAILFEVEKCGHFSVFEKGNISLSSGDTL